MSDRQAPDVDPVTLEVVRNGLVGIAEEAMVALRHTASSPNIKERVDCSTAVFDAEGRMLAQAAAIPVHLGSMPASVAAAMAAFGRLLPGDQVLVSDPYAGGTHLPDWTLVGPVHDEQGRLVGFAANRAHHADVGGAAPGSMPAMPVDVLAEGLRIPPVRVVREGEEDRDVRALLLANTRTPDERIGDLRAQVGANRVTGRRLLELAATHGERWPMLTAATLDHAERLVRAALRAVPDGTSSAQDVLDDDGRGTQDIRIHAEVRISGGDLHVDMRGCDPQVRGPVNAPRAVTRSAALYVLRAVFAPDAPVNAGTERPLTLETEPGTVVDPRSPAPVAAGNVETSQRIVDVLLAALAPLVPDRVPAGSQGTMNNTLVGGTDPRSGQQFTYYETVAGGQGAGPWGPGADAIQSHMTNTANTPIEAFELAYPMRVRELRLREGSGGTGQHAGGRGLRRVLEVLADDATVSVLGERRLHAPPGLDGGSDGAVGRTTLRHPDGQEEVLPPKATRSVERGTLVVLDTPGGGGWGRPESAGDPPRQPGDRPGDEHGDEPGDEPGDEHGEA